MTQPAQPLVSVRRILTALSLTAIVQCAHAQLAAPTGHATGTASTDVILADFDGDTDQDVFVSDSAGQVVWFENAPAGTFPGAPSGSFPLLPGQVPVHLASGRLDSNPEGDVVVCEQGVSQVNLRLYPSATNNTFPIPGGFVPFASTVVDLNRDSLCDVAIATQDPITLEGWVFVIRQTVPDVFVMQPIPFACGIMPRDIGHGRFDAGQFFDLATANQGGASISILINTSPIGGVVSFAPEQQFVFPPQRPEALTIADFDCDGYDDIVAVSRVSAFGELYSCTAPILTVAQNPVLHGSGGSFDVDSGDINCDGQPDIVVGHPGTPATATLVTYAGAGTFNLPIPFNGVAPGSMTTVAVGDMTNDGTADVAFVVDGPSQLSIFRNTCQRCCHDYCEGIDDGFATPTPAVEDACPCPSLLAWMGTLPYAAAFDVPNNNLRFAHSIDQLPDNILAGSLVIRMRAENFTAVNDRIGLGLNATNTEFLWTADITDLPETGGTWAPAQVAEVELNLACLPGGYSLIPYLNCTPCFDIYVQNDTTVDSIELRLITGAQSNCRLDLDVSPVVLGGVTTFSIDNVPAGDVAGVFATLTGPGAGPCIGNSCLCLDGASLLFIGPAAGGTTTFDILVPNIPLPSCLDITSQAFSFPSGAFSPTKSRPIY